MQTLGTVFPANLENLADGKPRIRSQYVYSVSNPVENVSQWKELKKGDPNTHQLSGELRESLEQPELATAMSEDQKVRWHATPFEERLEKALSEESFISQRYARHCVCCFWITMSAKE
ncbi:hypothetical protein HS088_TW08G00637 [Tripterygium wilfordii]|uniref:Uncharacterized protein n=1 Tax=Tripterygium wilfordii TaxID=458696 RepID=A0A7J7DCE1_TRIWF|nr:hypothetical protein HS088_TW08G00637 [Tripterygium wilfordii]